MQDNYTHRADQLDLKEKELRAKEAELRKLETELRATGALRPEKNWPRCCPFTHHDIAGEVRRRGAEPSLDDGVPSKCRTWEWQNRSVYTCP